MSYKKLQEFVASTNIADLFSKEELMLISDEVIRGFDIDKSSMSEWLAKADEIMELVNLPREDKHFPWTNASNIKYPLLTTAVIQFGARTLPELARNGEIVKHRVIGRDETGFKSRKGRRVAEYLNYKLMDESALWWDQHDKLLHVVPTIGTAFVKSCFNPLTGEITSDLLHYKDVVVNKNIKSLKEASRISHRVASTKNNIVQGMMQGVYSEYDISNFEIDETPNDIDIELLEQHCWLDLDKDGYAEPYIVLLHPDSNLILRITANYGLSDIFVNPNSTDKVYRVEKKYDYFTDYHFLPNPDGSYFSNGFGTIVLSLNSTVNTILNQLVDSGTLSNIQGGFIGKGLGIRKGNFKFDLGEWKTVDSVGGRNIAENIYPLNFKEPSTVLYQLLGMVINATRDLTSTTEVMMGSVETQNTSPNTLAQTIQQGMTVYLAVKRRIDSGLKKELKTLFKLYGQYVDPNEYFTVLDLSEAEQQEVMQGMTEELKIPDFDTSLSDIVPVADGNSSTEMQRSLKSQGLLQLATTIPQLFNMPEVILENLIANGFTNPERFLAPPAQGPSPEEIQMQSEMAEKATKAQIEQTKLELDVERLKIEKAVAETVMIKNIAEAEAKEVGNQVGIYTAQVNAIKQDVELKHKAMKNESDIRTQEAKKVEDLKAQEQQVEVPPSE